MLIRQAILIFVAYYLFARHVLRPVLAITNSIARRAAGELNVDIPVYSDDELGKLAEALNAMNARLDSTFRSLHVAKAEAEVAKADAVMATKTKSEFLANMSHEIRTPMTAILGFTDLLFEGGDVTIAPAERLDAISTIRRNGEHLLCIINDILDISKIEAGKMTVEQLTVSPPVLCSDVASLVKIRVESKGLQFHTEFIGAIPETIQTDPTRLRQILINLIGNSVKFTETGGIRVVVRCNREVNPPVMQFDVMDTGIGMSEDQAAGIFEAFTQADSSTTRKFGGSGLGLVISKRLAKMLGGDVKLMETRQGFGTCFRATIAVGSLDTVAMQDTPLTAMAVAKVQKIPTVAVSLPAGCRILLAEDGPDNQRLISHILRKAGAEVTVVSNGKEALDSALAARAAGSAFEIILMDIQMPVLDGYQATMQLRDNDYSGTIIALTAHAMASDREKCINSGCDDYGSKPIDRIKLIETINSHLQKALVAV